MGVRSLFIRLSGCNLHCSFCDTKYASLYTEVSRAELKRLINRAYSRGVRNVIWTGGEPGLQIAAIKDVIAEVEDLCMTHAVETNGSIPFGTAAFDLVVVSPKDTEISTRIDLTKLLDNWGVESNVVFKPVIDSHNVNWWMNWASSALNPPLDP